ncbi:MAG: type I-C CRISPR-associated protein Cas8c/Csd1 [Methylococcaceae bacterium]|nr:type I-C CRISPR-associated protein Cas8c/Csd1 [Methylococcaceae bacterium]
MLLKLLNDFAESRNLLDDLAFSPKAVRWMIPLDGEGNLIGSGPRETAGEKNRGLEYSAPQTSRVKNAGGVAEFLADNLTGLFGLDTDPEKDQENIKKRREREANNQAKCGDFWRQIQEAFDATQCQALQALLSFQGNTADMPSFLRWGVATEPKPNEKPAWWLTTALGTETKLGPDNFSFVVEGFDGLLLNDETTLRPYWRGVYQKEIDERNAGAKRGICLITGDTDAPIAATHGIKIKGVPNTQSFGAAIVSFDKPAFTSYGFDQSQNAPSSIRASTAYGIALNYLLSRDDHHLRIGQTSVCFWARETQQASSRISHLFNRPDPASIKDFLTQPWAGLDRELVKKDRFYSVTLSGNAGRIVVRHWLHITLEQALENFKQWFDDLEITPYGDPSVYDSPKHKAREKDSMPPLALFRLACSTVRDAKDLQSETLTQLYRAALEGSSPPILLLKPMLYRLQVDLPKHGLSLLANPSRFALLRLIVNRNRPEGIPMIEPQVFETSDVAYNCGRLLAIFDSLQRSAHGTGFDGATVSERYFGAASTTPNSAFSLLWKLHTHHLKKLRQQGEKGRRAANKIKNTITETIALFRPDHPGEAPQLPRHFNLVEQGRFALGFYQQMAVRKAAIDEYVRRKKAGEIKPEDADDDLELTAGVETGQQ